jgi:FtsP/CotA-like multicopper oxidase with cupredoxin domain
MAFAVKIPVARNQVSLSIVLTLVFLASSIANAQPANPGQGKTPAKLASPATKSVDAADQACLRYVAGSTVPAPPELESHNGVLEVTMKLVTATDLQGRVRFCYVTDTGLESPTLRVNPGDRLIIHFHNDLPPTSSDDEMAPLKITLAAKNSTGKPTSACSGSMGINVSNLHFHGTTVAPLCGQDETIHTLVQPGQSFDYNVQIPANEPPGLYWYHPHPHGISEEQVQGGATAALIVEGLQNAEPATAGLPERTFVIRDQSAPASENVDKRIPPDLSINYVPATVTSPNYMPAVIQTNPAQQELWRVANTSAETTLNLQYTVNGIPQPMQLVAIDGYPIAYGGRGKISETVTSILIAPAARAEFVVKTPNVAEPAQLFTQYWNAGPRGDYDPARPLADIVSQDGVENGTAPGTSATRHLPSSAKLQNISRFASLTSLTPAAQRRLYFSEVAPNLADVNSPTTYYLTVEGQTPAIFRMDQEPNIVARSGTVEDWVVENRAPQDHIFHIHQLHFQVLEVNGKPVNDPALRDTVDIPYWSGSGPYPSVKVRMDFRDPNIVGTFVYHCHIIDHEDRGMMGEIQVLPPEESSSSVVLKKRHTVQ